MSQSRPGISEPSSASGSISYLASSLSQSRPGKWNHHQPLVQPALCLSRQGKYYLLSRPSSFSVKRKEYGTRYICLENGSRTLLSEVLAILLSESLDLCNAINSVKNVNVLCILVTT
jgi:hypothetical protein